MKRILSTLISCFLIVLGQSQDRASIAGQILNQEEDALAYATIILYSTMDSSMVKTAYSDAGGSFEFRTIPRGTYWIQASFAELGTENTEKLELKAGQELEIAPIVLKEKEVQMTGVNVYAQKQLIEVKPDKTIFNVSGTINSIGENAFELLRKAPGVVIDNQEQVMLMGKSGVSIYIDGKRSPLSVADLAVMLKGMQASQIESIEIISNPSARYEAEGNAGIINIVLKKDKSLGTKGTIGLGLGRGRFNKYEGSLSMNSRNKVANLFGSYSGKWDETFGFTNFYRRQNGYVLDQQSDRKSETSSNNLKLGADFFLSKEHTLGIMYTGFFSDGDSRTESLTPISLLSTGEVQQILDAEDLGSTQNSSQSFNLNYAYKNKAGVSWNLDADYGRYRLRASSVQPNIYLDPTGEQILREISFATEAPRDIDIYTLKADHQQKLWGGNFSAGAKSAFIQTNNTFNFSDLISGAEVLNMDRSNNFVYKEYINAVYTSFQKRINAKWNWELGLRGEHTLTRGELTSLQDSELDSVRRSYFSLFPTGGLTFNPNRSNSFRLNYSRRIDRPRYQDLNPFLTQMDQLSYSRGNPFLRPQYSHSIQGSYTYKYRYTASIGYTLTEDYFTRLTDILSEEASFITLENLSTREVLSANISAPINLYKWWSTYSNLNLSHTQNRGDFNEAGEVGRDIDIARTTFSIYQQHTFSLTENFNLELSGFYNSPSIWGANYLSSQFWGINGGARYRFWNKKGSLRLSVNDIFYSMQWQGTQVFGGLYYDASGGWESRQVRLNFSYNFGNEQVKASRKRKTGMQRELKRMNGGNGPGN